MADRHGGDPFRCGGAETEVHDLRANKVNAGDVRATVVGARTERKSSRRVCRARPSRGPSALRVDDPRAVADPLCAEAARDLQLTVASEGTASSVSGKALVHGTVTCSQPASVSVSGAVFQVVKKVLVRGTFGALVNCTPGTAVAWTASATPNDTTPFAKGDAEVSTQATAYDSEYGDYATVDDTTIVTLSRS
ncbi:hypothetical protein OG799_08750 [Micromonospora sp. NBC_00898]|uniref:hypothetical protein n=1 Tax=Micromonospora sp. NBC_00898 TaxID=2975981 RepID=UPI00386E6FEB|nr:hypothetical protein OG799_08750 [Micromonospora sp. NBC_00898]